MRILLTGGTGYIATRMIPFLPEYEFITISRDRNINNSKKHVVADLTIPGIFDSIMQEFNPDWVFHFAAYTNPARNEKDPELSKLTNVDMTLFIVDACKKSDTPICFLSTDKVYDGIKYIAEEDDDCHPAGIYGLNKLTAERLIVKNLKKYAILRLPIVHCLRSLGENNFIDRCLREIESNKKITVYDNIYRSFLLVEDLSLVIKKILLNNYFGILNVGTKFPESYCDRIISLRPGYANNIIRAKGDVFPLKQGLSVSKLNKLFEFQCR